MYTVKTNTRDKHYRASKTNACCKFAYSHFKLNLKINLKIKTTYLFFFQVVARHEDLLSQATGIESLEGTNIILFSLYVFI